MLAVVKACAGLMRAPPPAALDFHPQFFAAQPRGRVARDHIKSGAFDQFCQ
jgi:hypothetical protein